MALWGNNDNIQAGGTVALDYDTLVVTGTGTSFGTANYIQEGDVIRFGHRGIAQPNSPAGVYFGDAVVKSIASTTSLTIASTTGLSGAAIAATTFYVTQLPKYTVDNSKYSQNSNITSGDNLVYGISDDAASNVGTSGYELTDAGWVGITTYVDTSGSLRVKRETLVAMSGITTGVQSIKYPTGVSTNYGPAGNAY
mgnify:CR=1 FL=1